MSKKCKMCGADAEWKWDSELYCEHCMRGEFAVKSANMPRVCEECGDPIDRMYYTDVWSRLFCSVKCALEYNGACETEKEQEE